MTTRQVPSPPPTHLSIVKMSIAYLIDRLEKMNLKAILCCGLLISTLIFLVNLLHAYHSQRDTTVGVIAANAIFGIVINVVTLIGNRCDNYYLLYVYFIFTIIQSIIYLLVVATFPWVIIIVLYLDTLALLTFVRTRMLRKEMYEKMRYCNANQDKASADDQL